MAGLGLNMNILVPNINHRGQKDLSFEVRHKAYARPLACISHQSSRLITIANIKSDREKALEADKFE